MTAEHQNSVSIKPATEFDLPAILSLLTQNKLPPEGLAEHLSTALVAWTANKIVGCAALEPYGPAALLRSVAVAPDYRGLGLGQRLTKAALLLAQQKKMTHVYLLTETAGEFFPKFGFRVVERTAVPSAVQESLEFTSLCPDSALAMELRLK